MSHLLMTEPDRTNSRILGYDLARALAILGMVVVNFKTTMHATQDHSVWWLSIFNLLDGRASAIFVILAGVGITLRSSKARHSGEIAWLHKERLSLFKRSIFLFVVGLLYVEIWPADILHYYGVYIAFAACFFAASTRVLWGLAFGIVMVFPVLFVGFDYGHSWNWATLEYADFWSLKGFLRNLLFNGFHPVFPWAAFLLIGMAFGRLAMNQVNVRWRIFGWGVAATIVGEVAALFLKFYLQGIGGHPELVKVLTSNQPMPPLPLYFLSATGSACVVIALCVAIGERYRDAKWLQPLVHTGQLALTLYIAHVVLGMGMLEEMNRLDHQSLGFAVASALLFCVVAIAFSHWWRRHFKQGPLEWLMRKVTFTT